MRTVLFAALSVVAGQLAWAGAAPSGDGARVIVKMRTPLGLAATASDAPWVSAQSAAQSSLQRRQRVLDMGRRAGVSIGETRELTTRMHVARAGGMTSAELARRLSAQSDVEYAVVDELRHPASVTSPNDPLYGPDQSSPYPAVGQWYLRAPDATLVSAINAPGAWAITPGSRSVVVAVLDTGIRYDHEDLQGKLLPGYNMISSGVVANNGVGRSDNASDLGDWLTQREIDANPQTFKSKNETCAVEPTSSWHGTQVAGLIGASADNGVGMTGLGGHVQVLPVRVLGKCGGYDSDIISGMFWAAGLPVSGVPTNPTPAQVINLSLGASSPCSDAYKTALTTLAGRNVVVVAAAGNTKGLAVESPGNCPDVIAVSALRHVGTKVGYSSIGPEVAISAPGGNRGSTSGVYQYPIVTTTNSGSTVPAANGSTYTSATNPSLGTSFATPLVAGTVALMLAVKPDLTPAQVTQILKSTAHTFPTTGGSVNTPACQAPSTTEQDECYCTQSTCGAGMLNAADAVAAAHSLVTAPVARISVLPEAMAVGQPTTLSATDSTVGTGAANLSNYQWTLVDGGGIVTALSGDPSSASVSVTPTAAGRFTVRLTVTDDQGAQATTDLTLTVGLNLSITVAPATTTSSGGGGGGSTDDASLIALSLLAVAGVGARFKRRRAATHAG